MLSLLDRLQAKAAAASLTQILRGAEKAVPAPLPQALEDILAGGGGGSHRIASHRSPFCPVSRNEKMKSNSGKTS